MSKLKRGTLINYVNHRWYMHISRSPNHSPLLVDNFSLNTLHLIRTSQLTRVHPPFHAIFNYHHQSNFTSAVAWYISAATLRNLDTPILLSIYKHKPSNHDICQKDYDKKYMGLRDLLTCITIGWIFKKNTNIIDPALPTITISTAKHDENGKPKCSKWCIVALGNLDLHEWSTNTWFYVVIFMLELRFLISLTVHRWFVLRSGDVKKALRQYILPPDESYFLRPPAGCIHSSRATYWLVK